MNRIHCFRVGRIAAVLAGFAASVLVVLTSTTAAFAYVDPAPGSPAGPVPPPRVHTIVTGGMPGWQITLIAIGAALLAAAVAVIVDRAYTAHRQVTAPQP